MCLSTNTDLFQELVVSFALDAFVVDEGVVDRAQVQYVRTNRRGHHAVRLLFFNTPAQHKGMRLHSRPRMRYTSRCGSLNDRNSSWQTRMSTDWQLVQYACTIQRYALNWWDLHREVAAWLTEIAADWHVQQLTDSLLFNAPARHKGMHLDERSRIRLTSRSGSLTDRYSSWLTVRSFPTHPIE